MIEQHPLKLLHEGGSTSVGYLSGGIIDPDAHQCRLDFDHPSLGRLSFSGFDFFRCLRELRLALEAQGIKALCNGARENAFVSGMAAQMGYGLKVYLVEPGSLVGDGRSMVGLLEETSPDTVVTVPEQDAFLERFWNRSAANANGS
jgi:hypothetical protein